MALKLRAHGTKLTADELDGNFLYLERQIDSLRQIVNEQSAKQPSQGRADFGVLVENGNFKLQIPQMAYKGSFDDKASYVPGDFVFHENAFWFLSNNALDPGVFDAAKWHCLIKFSQSAAAKKETDRTNAEFED